MVFEKKQLSKALAIALMVACAVAFMPLLNGQAFAAAKKPAKVKSLKAAQVADTMTAKATWKKGKNCKKYNVKVDGVLVAKKQKAKSYTTEALTEGAHKIAVAGVNGKKVGKYKTVTVNIVAPTPPITKLEIKEAKQSGQDTFTVVFNRAVETTPTITVAKGTVEQKVVSTEWSADKTSVVLKLDTAIAKADYTIVVKSLEADLTATVAGDVAVVEKAEFVSNNLVLTTKDKKEGRFSVIGYDQFGGAIDPDIDTAHITVAGATATAAQAKNGVVVFTAKSATAFKEGDAVAVALVYAKQTKTLSGTLTVSAASHVAVMEVGDVTTDNKDYQGKKLTAATFAADDARYYLPIKAKDQYGEVLDAATLNQLTSDGLLILTPVKASVAAAGFTEDEDGNVILGIKGIGEAGTAIINFLSVGTGNTAKNIEVLENEKIDTLTADVPALKVESPAEITLTATDQYGDAVDLYEAYHGTNEYTGTTLTFVTDNLNTTATLTGAYFTVKKNTGKKTLTVTLTPEKESVVMVIVTASGKASSATYTASKASVLAKINGVDADNGPVTEYVLGANINVDLNNFGLYAYQDQYGDAYTPTIADREAFELSIAPPKKAVATQLDGTTVKAAADQKAGSDTYTVTLKKKADGTTYGYVDVTFTVSDAADLDYSIKMTIDDEEATTAAIGHTYDLSIVGMDGTKEVPATGAKFTNLVSNDKNVTVSSVSGGKETATLSVDKDIKEGGTATLTALIVAGDATKEITKEVPYSAEASKGTTVVLQQYDADAKEWKDVEDVNFEAVPYAGSRFLILDQYGLPMNATVTLSSYKDADGKTKAVVPVGVAYADPSEKAGQLAITLNGSQDVAYGDNFVVQIATTDKLAKANFIYNGDPTNLYRAATEADIEGLTTYSYSRVRNVDPEDNPVEKGWYYRKPDSTYAKFTEDDVTALARFDRGSSQQDAGYALKAGEYALVDGQFITGSIELASRGFIYTKRDNVYYYPGTFSNRYYGVAISATVYKRVTENQNDTPYQQTSTTRSPYQAGWYELNNGAYVRTNDRNVVPDKTYYIRNLLD